MDDAFFYERHRIGDHGLDVAQQVLIGAATGSPSDGLLELVDTWQTEVLVILDVMPTFINVIMLLAALPFLVLSALAVIEPSLQMAADASKGISGH